MGITSDAHVHYLWRLGAFLVTNICIDNDAYVPY